MTRDELDSSTGEPGRSSARRLGERLRRARLHRNLTQGEVAKNLFSTAYVSGVERGQIRPSLGALEKLAERLDMPMAKLLAEDDSEIPPSDSEVNQQARLPQRHTHSEIESSLRSAHLLSFQGKREEAIDLLIRLRSQYLSSRETAQLHWLLASYYNLEGRAEDARRTAAEAISPAERSGEQELAARLHLELGRAFSLLQNHEQALEQYRACLQAAQEQVIRDPAFRMEVLLNLGAQYASDEEYGEAISSLLQAADVAKEVTQSATLGSNYSSISQTLASRGDHAGARSYAVRSLGAYEEAKNHRAATLVYTELGTALARSGQMDHALTQLNRAYDSAMGQQDEHGIAEAARNLALVHLEQKHTGKAQEAAEKALSAAQGSGDTTLQAMCLLVLAQVQDAQKRTSKADESFELAIELLQAAETPAAAAQLRSAYAQFSEYLERRGESERAFAQLKLAFKASQQGKLSPHKPPEGR